MAQGSADNASGRSAPSNGPTGQLADRVALVTGAGRGIGLAIARAFAKQGADVVVADLHEESAARVADELRLLGRSALALEVSFRGVGGGVVRRGCPYLQSGEGRAGLGRARDRVL